MVKVNPGFIKTEFYQKLELSLASSSEEQRKTWATTIIEKSIDLKGLYPLLGADQKTASRFLWLLSNIGIQSPERLLIELPFLFDLCKRQYPSYKASFASFWMYAGVPPENEGEAIDLLFHLLLSDNTSISIRSRALSVLYILAKKYPELKNELRICITDQIDRYSKDFHKRSSKILREIEQELN